MGPYSPLGLVLGAFSCNSMPHTLCVWVQGRLGYGARGREALPPPRAASRGPWLGIWSRGVVPLVTRVHWDWPRAPYTTAQEGGGGGFGTRRWGGGINL